jgi:threonylcarbamoyladenosine tRNA methylthiotransferase MtaB
MDTFIFLHSLDISDLHVCTYSERPNRLAETLPGKVPHSIRDERNAQLRNLSEKKRMEFYSRFEGTMRNVLFEAGKEGEMMYGFTDNYIKVAIPYDSGLVNTVAEVELGEICDGIVKGRNLKALLV